MLAKKVLETIPRSIRVLRTLTLTVLDGPLTFHQTRALFLIREGLGQSQIAEQFQVSPAAVCKLMHQLSEKGFISMGPGKDRRERELTLTPLGARSLNSVTKLLEKKLNKGLGSLTEEERDDLMKGLDVLNKLMARIKEG